jgi:hypothetical protein
MATRHVSKDPVSDMTRLTNRVAVLAFASAFTLIVAMVALPNVFSGEGEPGRRIAASAALIVAVVVTAVAWRARAQLRAARQRSESSPRSSNIDGGTEASSAGDDARAVAVHTRRSRSDTRPWPFRA